MKSIESRQNSPLREREKMIRSFLPFTVTRARLSGSSGQPTSTSSLSIDMMTFPRHTVAVVVLLVFFYRSRGVCQVRAFALKPAPDPLHRLKHQIARCNLPGESLMSEVTEL
ncbi:hypothetical protein RRG08_038504 [Elysia crispata]|uniref:Uncharacterized protein n=1 Tax=Elysia crispata TaxID=231223 RepID=A0AAE1DZ96_9GAST|nr:hypothetical protein RRG08_038504 [Elysia crispata]